MGTATSTMIQPNTRVFTLPAERDGESKIYRSGYLGEGQPFMLNREPGINTLYESLLSSVTKYPDHNYLGSMVDSTYQWLTYEQVFNRVKVLGSGLNQFVQPKDRIGLTSINRVEWTLTEHASNAFSITLVPLYDSLGKTACIHIIKECSLNTIVCSSEKVKTLLEYSKETSIKTIISYNDPTDEQLELAKEVGVTIISFAEVEERGRQKLIDPIPPKPDDVCTICYTSGTTGLPKGVIITHQNLVAATSGLMYGDINITEKDIHLSYLPFAHSFERMISTAMMMSGASIGYYSGDPKKLFDDIVILNPTIFVTVPRLLGRLYDKAIEEVNVGGVKQTVFDTAYQDKLENYIRKGILYHPVYDSLIFSRFKEKLGSNIRLIITGSAPLATNVLDFIRVCFCVPVIEGYGQTETSVAGTRTYMWDIESGIVGVPVPSIEVKLIDVPSLGYLTSEDPPRGEVCFRGPTCTQGYFNNEEKTKELIDEHGWIHSGDVGSIDSNGNLKLIDRVKNLFKLSQGEYIAPEKIEQIINQSKWVSQSFIYGESLKSALVGVIVPEHGNILKWAEEVNHANKGNFEVLCTDEELNKIILDDIIATGKKQDLKPFELPRKIHLSPNPFTTENDTLSPTFKLKRPQATAMYKQYLEEMYGGIE